MTTTLHHHTRRGSDWDLDYEREHVHIHNCDPFVLWVLEAVQKGKVTCGGCFTTFTATKDVALITECVGTNSIALQAYCMACATKHADDLAVLPELPARLS